MNRLLAPVIILNGLISVVFSGVLEDLVSWMPVHEELPPWTTPTGDSSSNPAWEKSNCPKAHRFSHCGVLEGRGRAFQTTEGGHTCECQCINGWHGEACSESVQCWENCTCEKEFTHGINCQETCDPEGTIGWDNNGPWEPYKDIRGMSTGRCICDTANGYDGAWCKKWTPHISCNEPHGHEE